MAELELRGVGPKDLGAIRGLMMQLRPGQDFPKGAFEERYQKMLSDPLVAYQAAALDGEMIGFVSLRLGGNLVQGPGAIVDELIVDEKYRGRGVGRALLRWALERARREGCQWVQANSNHHRLEAHRFYQRQGFRDEGKCFIKGLQ